MRRKPSEVKLVAELLEAGAEDSTELAKDVIDSLDGKRDEGQTWHVVAQYKGKPNFLISWGPYPTQMQARKAIEAGKLPIYGHVGAFITPVYSPTSAVKLWEKVDAKATTRSMALEAARITP